MQHFRRTLNRPLFLWTNVLILMVNLGFWYVRKMQFLNLGYDHSFMEKVRKHKSACWKEKGGRLWVKFYIKDLCRGTWVNHFSWQWRGRECILWAFLAPKFVNPSLNVKMTAFWDVAPCSLVEVYRLSRGTSCLHHQGYDLLIARWWR
jgi:hypothetical protein